jgi:hypothetical protein
MFFFQFRLMKAVCGAQGWGAAAGGANWCATEVTEIATRAWQSWPATAMTWGNVNVDSPKANSGHLTQENDDGNDGDRAVSFMIPIDVRVRNLGKILNLSWNFSLRYSCTVSMDNIIEIFTRNITHVTGIDIYICTRTCVQGGMAMRQNLFMDLLVHEINGYQIFLSADIKYYLSRITERSIQQSLWACDSPWLLISRTLLFGLNDILMSVFNSTVLLSYHAIRVFSIKI